MKAFIQYRSVLYAGLALAVLLMPAAEGHAVPIEQSFLLDQSNDLADGVSYGIVTLTADTGTGTVQFEIDALVDSDVGNGIIADINFGIQAFGFNTTLPDGTIAAGDFALPSGWAVDIGSNNVDGFGKFELISSGSGSDRLDPLVFTINNLGANAVIANFLEVSTGNAGQGNEFFAGHVAGFLPIQNLSGQDITSHFIGGSTEFPPVSVPEPSVWMLLVIGLGGLAILTRRSRPAPCKTTRPPRNR